mgnify:CR=1 FL=1|tara:strand:- start:373 stop:549 length:177 start_codon:yes stop_codon:yes gene_type:complete
MSQIDKSQDLRISKLEERMLLMEQTIIELRGMTKVMRYIAVAVAVSLGMDVQGVVGLI